MKELIASSHCNIGDQQGYGSTDSDREVLYSVDSNRIYIKFQVTYSN